MTLSRLLRPLLLLLMLVGAQEVCGAGYTRTLTDGLSVSGYVSKNFYNFQTNTPAVLPTTGGLRFRAYEKGGYWGLHNYDASEQSAIVSIPVEEGDLLVLQQYNDDYQTTISIGTKNETLSTSTGYQCFDITQDADEFTITTPRYGGVIAVLVMSSYCKYTVYASDGTNVIGTVAVGTTAVGGAVTMAYPQYILNGTTLHGIAANDGEWFRTTFTPDRFDYTVTLNYTNETINNIIYYTEGENIEGAKGANNKDRASNGRMGYTGSIDTWKTITRLSPGHYILYTRGVNGNSATRNLLLHIGDYNIKTNTSGAFTIPNGIDVKSTSEEITVSESSDLSIACEGSSQSGLDWLYIQRTDFGWKPTEEGWNPTDNVFTVSLTDVDYNNRLNLSTLPKVVDPGDPTAASVTYTQTGTPVPGWWAAGESAALYPTRLTKTGDVTVQATSGVSDATATYTLRVVAGEGNGTYDGGSRTFTFDQPGVLNSFYTVADVPGITMTLGVDNGSGNPTTVVVNDANVGPVLKVIDGNGYSHPNLSGGGVIPAEGVNGGTYYVFRPTQMGNLHVVGNMNDASLYEGSSNSLIASAASGTTLDAFLEKGKVYYLYNNNNTPLLHSFQFLALNEYEIDFSKMNFTPNANGSSKNLDRTIPGFKVEFNASDNNKYESGDRAGQIHFRDGNGGGLTITPRLINDEGIQVLIKAIKLSITDCDETTTVTFTDATVANLSSNGDHFIRLSGTDDGEVSFTVSANGRNDSGHPGKQHFKLTNVVLYYLAEDNSNPETLLDKTKVAPKLTLDKETIDVKNGDATSGSINLTVTTVEGATNRYYAWAPTTPDDGNTHNLSFSQNRESVATLSLVNSTTINNGTHVPQISYTTAATGTSVVKITLAGNDYFAPAETTLTIINSANLAVGETMSLTGVLAGQEIKITAKSDGDESSTALTLSTDAEHSFGSTEETFYTYAAANGTFTITNNGPGILTISDLNAYYRTYTVNFSYPKYDDAYPQAITYVGRKLTPALTVIDDETGADVRDKFTYSFSRDVTTYFGNISTELETLGQGIGLADSGEETQTPTTVTVTLTTKGNNGYLSPASSFTSPTTIDVLPAHQEWDFRNALAAQPTLSNWTKSGSNYYSPNGTEFIPAIRTDNSKVLKEARGMEFHSSMRLYMGTGNDALRMFTGGSAVRIPVFEGQEVIIRANSHGTRTYSLSNATDIYGNNVSGFKCSGITELKFLAQADGFMQFTNDQNLECNILSINVMEPQLHFEEDAITVSTQYTDPITNPVLKGLLQEGKSAAYAIVSGSEYLNSGLSALNTSTGTISGGFRSDAGGQEVVISATATDNQPNHGTYTIKIINLHFPDPAEVSLTLDNATGTVTKKSNESGADAWRPVSTELSQLETDISYTCATVSGNPNPSISQEGAAASVAYYTLKCSGVGTVRVTAKSGYVEAHLLVTINGTAFDDAAPSISDTESEYTPSMSFGEGISLSDFSFEIIGKKGDADLENASVTVISSSGKLTGLSGHGVVQVRATGSGAAAGITRVYNLTRAYSASSGKDWRFYDIGHGTAEAYNSSTEKTKALTPIVDGDITGFNVDEYITDSKEHGWRLKYKAPPSGTTTKGGKPRWVYEGRVSGDNGFIIEETAGLVFITPEDGFTVRSDMDERDKDDPWKCYRHVGLRLYGSKMIIPKLKKGDFVEIKTIRHSDNSGEQVIATNLTDLNGKEVDPSKRFGLLGAQHSKYDKTNPTVDYPDIANNDIYGLCGSYTFIVQNDGDVSFMLADGGNMDILQVRIYKGNYQTTLLNIKKMDDTAEDAMNSYGRQLGSPRTENATPIQVAEGEFVKEAYAHANVMNSTNTGPGKYVMVVESNESGALYNADPETYFKELTPVDAENNIYVSDNGGLTLESPLRWSNGGAGYNIGVLTATKQSNASIRLQCYTKGWEYMTAYSPVPSIPVGITPAQTYPYTWDFANMAGGALADDDENAYNTIADDGGVNWRNSSGIEYDLLTVKKEGAYYVAGSQLVTKGIIIKETKGLGFDITTDGAGNLLGTKGSLKLAIDNPASPTENEKMMTLKGILTIPSLTPSHRVYIKSDRRPDSQTNATLVSTGSDSNTGVYRYSVEANGHSTFTFNEETKIYAIGVTDITKTMTQLSGTAWATESRDKAIDHTLTGFFTTNPVKAYAVIESNGNPTYASDKSKTTVAVKDERSVVPANQGLVLKQVESLPTTTDKATYQVPLFVPAVTTEEDAASSFNNNLMRPNVEERTFDSETENFTGKDGEKSYTVFILSNKYMTWRKEGSNPVSYDDHFNTGDVAAFYRMHLYGGGASYDGETNLNTLGANKAYLLLRTDKINDAIWGAGGANPAPRYIGIQGVSDMEEYDATLDTQNHREGTYNLSGQKMADDGPLPPGIYIQNGKKVIVR